MHPKRIEPGPGQESVWDYPRPPRVEPTAKRLRVLFNGQLIAETTRALRVLETSAPPTYYIPPDDIQLAALQPSTHRTFCEFKGQAGYYDVQVGDRLARRAAWFYAAPSPGYAALKNYVAFYAGLMEACYVDDERVLPQAGDFYGGWITADIVGPFKGGPGTMGW